MSLSILAYGESHLASPHLPFKKKISLPVFITFEFGTIKIKTQHKSVDLNEIKIFMLPLFRKINYFLRY